MNDIDYIFTELYNIDKRVYSLGNALIEKEYTHMVKILNYGLSVVGSTITITPPVDSTVSQYQNILVNAHVSGVDGINKTIKLSINTPEFATGSEADLSDFNTTIHLSPSIKTVETFSVFLNEIIGNDLEIGVINNCNAMFTIVDGSGGVSKSDVFNISLYKTNVDLSYQPNDITHIFIKLNELTKRLDELEAN